MEKELMEGKVGTKKTKEKKRHTSCKERKLEG